MKLNNFLKGIGIAALLAGTGCSTTYRHEEINEKVSRTMIWSLEQSAVMQEKSSHAQIQAPSEDSNLSYEQKVEIVNDNILAPAIDINLYTPDKNELLQPDRLNLTGPRNSAAARLQKLGDFIPNDARHMQLNFGNVQFSHLSSITHRYDSQTGILGIDAFTQGSDSGLEIKIEKITRIKDLHFNNLYQVTLTPGRTNGVNVKQVYKDWIGALETAFDIGVNGAIGGEVEAGRIAVFRAFDEAIALVERTPLQATLSYSEFNGSQNPRRDGVVSALRNNQASHASSLIAVPYTTEQGNKGSYLVHAGPGVSHMSYDNKTGTFRAVMDVKGVHVLAGMAYLAAKAGINEGFDNLRDVKRREFNSGSSTGTPGNIPPTNIPSPGTGGTRRGSIGGRNP